MPAAGEPLWTDSDRAWALALLQVEDETCSGCGQPLAESTDPDSEYRYVAEVIRCHACTTAGRHAERFHQDGGDQVGAHVHVHPRERRGG
ncbi:hypothetical protein ACWGB8_07790 [Kitasatospora sp. NPDC054939]